MNDIKKKIWNIELVIDEIKEFPQTYKTILQDEGTKTDETILRRKLNNLIKLGVICKSNIPGTRFGTAIFFCLPKKYYILIEAKRIGGSEVYCFFEYKKVSRFYLKVNQHWKLNCNSWKKSNKEKIFFEGKILKWI